MIYIPISYRILLDVVYSIYIIYLIYINGRIEAYNIIIKYQCFA